MTANSPLLTVADLGRNIGDRWLWRGVDFELSAGDCLGLVAPSGVGKTLLLRNLVLLDPIDEGTVWFEGRSLSQWHLPDYRTRVAYLPQQSACFEGTVAENLQRVFTFSAHRRRQYNSQRIEEWLAQLGRHSDFLSLQATQLSGGEAQLLALLRALQLEPTVLLLDEPTASLDSTTTARVEDLLKTWLGRDRACIVTSHDPAQIERLTREQLHLAKYSA